MVISTQRKTKKFDLITENENVALLVHDFNVHSDDDPDSRQPDRPRYSITLNGRVCVEEGELAEHYRAIHLERNKKYSQFIVGEHPCHQAFPPLQTRRFGTQMYELPCERERRRRHSDHHGALAAR